MIVTPTSHLRFYSPKTFHKCLTFEVYINATYKFIFSHNLTSLIEYSIFHIYIYIYIYIYIVKIKNHTKTMYKMILLS
jgi:hypothetical protein